MTIEAGLETPSLRFFAASFGSGARGRGGKMGRHHLPPAGPLQFPSSSSQCSASAAEEWCSLVQRSRALHRRRGDLPPLAMAVSGISSGRAIEQRSLLLLGTGVAAAWEWRDQGIKHGGLCCY